MLFDTAPKMWKNERLTLNGRWGVGTGADEAPDY